MTSHYQGRLLVHFPLEKDRDGDVTVTVFYANFICTLQSVIIGKRLSENAPAGRAELRPEFRVPILIIMLVSVIIGSIVPHVRL